MKNNTLKFIQLFCAHILFFCGWNQLAFGMEEKEILKVEVSEETLDHVIKGKKTENSFLGGHDFGKYQEAGHTKDQSVFFDMKNNAFLVSSDKGLSLPELIKDLKDGKFTKNFHTLFPPNVLDAKFIREAFFEAFKEGNLNHDKGIFYTDYKKFKICGYFKEKDGTYYVTSIFPDFGWHFRKEFFKKEGEFEISRFLELSKDGKRWIREGVNLDNFDKIKEEDQETENNAYIKLPIDLICTKEKDVTMTSDEFYVSKKFKKYFEEEIINSEKFNKIDVLELFFQDSENPTVDEFKVMKDYISELIEFVPSKKNNNLNAFKNELVKYLKKSQPIHLIQSSNFGGLEIITNYVGGKNLKLEYIGGRNVELQLGEEIFKELLFINHLNSQKGFKWKFSNGNISKESLMAKRFAAMSFVENFNKKILSKEIADELSENKLSIYMYALPVKNDIEYHLVVVADEVNDPLKRHEKISLFAKIQGKQEEPTTVSFLAE